MVINTNKKLLVFVCLIISPIESILSMNNNWKPKNDENWDLETVESDFEPIKCNDPYGSCEDSEEKFKNIIKKNAFKLNDMQESVKVIPYYHTMQLTPCTCGMEYRLLDLGRKYFPRYIQTGTCKKTTCGPLYRCTERQYKVKVLREKEPNLESREGMILPDKLKDLYISEFITVVVACECKPYV